MRNEGTNRKMALVVHQVEQEEEKRLNVDFWLKRSISERLEEVCRLRRLYFTQEKEAFPSGIAKVVHIRTL